MDDASNNAQLESSNDASLIGARADVPEPEGYKGAEKRAQPRVSLLIRAAKLVTSHGEFVCVIRDISAIGISVRLFHTMPQGEPIELHMLSGAVYELKLVWERDNEAGFEFADPVEVEKLIHEVGEYPKRGLRLGMVFPIKIRTLTGTYEGVVENLSQQGARLHCKGLFAIDQSFQIESLDGGHELQDIRAKVRWRRNDEYGVVFDNTLSLSAFARFAARLQSPRLLS